MASTNERFGDQVRARRRELGLGPGDAAKRAGVSRPAWDSWEKGTVPTDKNWVALERALKWARGSVEAMLAGRAPTAVKEDASDSPPDDVRIDPADWAVMTPEHREQVVRILRAAAARRRERQRGTA